MGRIKTTRIKRVTKQLVAKHGDLFKPNFEENKKLVYELAEIPSKKLRNIVAGYTTRLMRKKAEEQA